MRIGPVDLSIPTLLYIAVLAVLLIAVPVLGLRHWKQIREGMLVSSIHEGLAKLNPETPGAVEKAIASCRTLIAADSGKLAPKMYLGCLLCRAGQYKEAREAFQNAADTPGATPDENSLARTSLGAAMALEGWHDNKPGDLKNPEITIRMAAAARPTPDALGELAILQSWKSDVDDAKLAEAVEAALKAPGAPSPAIAEQLYLLQGSVAARQQKPAEASEAFARVKGLNPENSQVGDASRMALLGALSDPTLDPHARRETIAKVYGNIDKLGANRNDAYVSMALAWAALRGTLNEPGTDPQAKAVDMFRALVAADSKDPRGYLGQIMLQEENITRLIKDVSIPVPGFTGEPPEPSLWRTPPQARHDITPEETRNAEVLRKILTSLQEIETLWKAYLERAAPEKSERIDAMTRRVTGLRRQAWVSPEQNRLVVLKLAVPAAQELAKIDDSGRGFYISGLIAIDLGELARARKEFTEAAKAGYHSPEMDKLLADLSRKPLYKEFGPLAQQRNFGAQPLVRAILDSPLTLGGLRETKLTFDGKETRAAVVGGTQVYATPSVADLSGGTHTLRVNAVDVLGDPLVFPQFSFGIDKEPPTWKVTPADGAEVQPAQVWTLSVEDPGGVDWHSLRAGIRSMRTATSAIDTVLIKDGHYARAIPSLSIKGSEPVTSSPFKLSGNVPFSPGDYQVWIEVNDSFGNTLKDQKKYTVK